MPMRSSSLTMQAGPQGTGRGDALRGKLARYTGGSVVAAACSELTLLLLYGGRAVAPAWASAGAWVAGAIPNYWLNRSWTWRQRGRPSLRHEVVPYLLIILVT